MTCRSTEATKLNHFSMVSKISSTHFSDNHAFPFLQTYLDNILFFASSNAWWHSFHLFWVNRISFPTRLFPFSHLFIPRSQTDNFILLPQYRNCYFLFLPWGRHWLFILLFTRDLYMVFPSVDKRRNYDEIIC